MHALRFIRLSKMILNRLSRSLGLTVTVKPIKTRRAAPMANTIFGSSLSLKLQSRTHPLKFVDVYMTQYRLSEISEVSTAECSAFARRTVQYLC